MNHSVPPNQMSCTLNYRQ